MTDDQAPSPEGASPPRAQRRVRRDVRLARRERCFSLMASGYSFHQIGRIVQSSVATVRREIDRALAERRLDAPERFQRVQVARLTKALRLAEAAIELGELKAVATYLRVIAALDRYHEAAKGPPPLLPTEPRPLSLPRPPRALTFAPLADDDPPPAEQAVKGAED